MGAEKLADLLAGLARGTALIELAVVALCVLLAFGAVRMMRGRAPGSIWFGANGGTLYSFVLGNESVSARYYYYDGDGPDKENRWRQVSVAEVQLDTLVVEPDEDRCYAVWRAVWNYDERAEDAYRRLLVEAA